MKTSPKIFGASVVISVVCNIQAHAATLAYWNFNSLSIAAPSAPGSGGVPTTIAPNSSTVGGSLALTPYGGTVGDFGGSTLNTTGGDPTGASLSLISSGVTAGPFPGNGTYIEIATLNFTGLSNIGITYASQRTNTGFNSNTWSFSTDGTTFNSVAPVNPPTSYGLITIDLSSFVALNNAPSVTFRYTVSGATSNSGNTRIDNLQIVDAIPEPSSSLLGLAAGLSLLGRRR